MGTNTSRLATALAAVGLVVLVAAGCDGGPPSGGPTPGPGTTTGAVSSATASPSASPTLSPTPPPTDPAIVFAADGLGAYVIGTALSDLSSRGLITGVVESKLCADSKGANATGRYAGQLTFSFLANRLVAVHTTAPGLVTPSGARVGMSLDAIQGIYGSRGTLITGTHGNKALVVRVPASGLAIVFYLDPTNTKVASMSGGEGERLEDAARTGEGC